MDTADGLLVLGEGFSQWSCVTVEEDEQDTRFINSHILLLPEVHPEELSLLTIRTAGKDGILLSESPAYAYVPGETHSANLPDIPLLPED